MIIRIRQLQSDDVDQAVLLANKTFLTSGQTSMEETFPLIFTKDLNLSFGAFDGDKLVSFFGLVPFNIKIGAASVSIISIGSVCTNPSYRGKGLASLVLKEAFSFADRFGTSLLLISGDRGLYLRNNCYYFGERNIYHIDNRNNLQTGKVREMKKEEFNQLFWLRRKMEVRYDIGISEWIRLVNASSYASAFKMRQEIYIVENNDNIQAYVIAGIPNSSSSKKEPIIIEWAGESNSVCTILSDLFYKHGVFHIRVPWHDKLNSVLNKKYFFQSVFNGGTIHVVRHDRLMEELTPYYRMNRVDKLEASLLDDQRVMVNNQETTSILTQKEFVDQLFNPKHKRLLDSLKVPLPNTEGLEYV
ncbi:GNAT family N-acetyltransferase [Virgibacillus pantothenticus]|uniref:GNAT family N-acetyltransferase n=1 Tax=Virgibacillus pantothenticus TaxID=1473 RepID=UPI000985F58C|nr:GNAT family N-acetyltransferase [Virgibacillus pantothenticus]